MSTLSDLPFEVLSLIHSYALHGEDYNFIRRNRAAWCSVCHTMHVFNQPELYKTVKFTLDYLTSNSYFTSFSSPDHIIYDTRIPLFLRTVQGNRELGKMVASLELSGYPLAPAVTGESELKKLPNYLPAIQYLTLGSAERRADADSMIDMEFLAAAGSLWKPLQALTIRGFHAVHYHPLLQPGKSVHFVQLDHLHIALYHSLSRPPSRLKFWDIKRWFPHSTTDRREREQASFRKLSLILDHRGWNSMVFGANPSPYFPFNPRNLTHLHLGGSHSYDTVPSITLADFPSLQRLGKSVSCYSELNPSASWISTFLHLDASRSGGTSLISRTRSHLQVVVLDLPIDCMTFLPSSVHFFQDIDLQAWQLGVKIHIFHEVLRLRPKSADILRHWELTFPRSWKADRVVVCWQYSLPGRRRLFGVFWDDQEVEAARWQRPDA